jgi:hypothetical protein
MFSFPTDPMDRFHLAIFVLHSLGAMAAMIMSFSCDVAQANQQAMVPASIPLNPLGNISAVRAHRAAFPWSEDALFSTHSWNPYLLVMGFEWLTAGFALCNLSHFVSHTRGISAAWISVGGVLAMVWFGSNSKRSELCVAMFIILPLSYAAAALQCEMFYKDRLAHKQRPTHHQERQSRQEEEEALLHVDSPLVIESRLW